jgi:outer membrane immunogenic protein
MIRNIFLSTSLALLGTATFAGKIVEPVMVAPVAVPMAAPMAPSQDWTGFYAGGQLTTGDGNEGLDGVDFSAFGVHAGYLHDFGSFVLGGEFDYDMGKLEGPFTNYDTDVARLKVIAGYDLGSFMPYIAAGISNVDVDVVNVSDTVNFYGLGGTYAINDQFRIGAEYLVHDTDVFDGAGAVGIDTLSLRASYSF